MNLNELCTPRVINLMRCASEGTKPLRLQQHLSDLRCSVSPTRSIKCWYYVATNRRTNSYLGHANIVVPPAPHGTIWNLDCFCSLVQSSSVALPPSGMLHFDSSWPQSWDIYSGLLSARSLHGLVSLHDAAAFVSPCAVRTRPTHHSNKRSE